MTFVSRRTDTSRQDTGRSVEGPVIVWLMVLDVRGLFTVLRLQRRQPCDSIRFIRATRAARWLSALLRGSGLPLAPCIALVRPVADLRCADGSGAFFSIHRSVLRIVAAARTRWRASDDPARLIACGFDAERTRQFLEKQLALELHDVVLLLHHVADFRGRDRVAERHIVIAPVPPCVDPADLAEPDVTVLPQRSWSGGGWPLVARIVCREVIARPAYLGVLAVGARLTGRRRVSSPRSATLAVAYKWGVDPRRMSDLFFLRGSDFDSKRLLVYFDDRSRTLTEQNRRLLDGLGLRWTVRRPTAASIRTGWCWTVDGTYVRRWRRSVAVVLAALAAAARRRRPRSALWQLAYLVQLLTVVDYWVAFYSAHNIRVDFHKEETDPDSVGRAIALDLLDGVSVGCHWSYYQFTTVLHSRPQHVYFAWGPYHARFLVEDESRVNWLVYSGHIFDQFFQCADLPRWRAETRGRLERHGARFVICLFDDTFGSSASTSRESSLLFYKTFIDELEHDPSLGLLIKPKSADDLLANVEFRKLIEGAQQLGRCLLLDHRSDDETDVSGAMRCLPVEAAVVADIAVALGSPTNSAAIQVALAGFRSVCWDAAQHLGHPLYEWGRDRVVFDDIERLVTAVREFRAAPAVRSDLGTYSDKLQEIDPYRDGQAATRIGRYLGWLMEGFDEELARDAAIALANRQFTAAYGTWTVASGRWQDRPDLSASAAGAA